MKKMLLAVSAAVAMVSSLPASAAQYTVSYTSTLNAGIKETFSAVLTTTDVADAKGFFTITSLIGTRNGIVATLSPIDTFGGNDNAFKPTPNFFNGNGLTYSAGDFVYNIFQGRSSLREIGTSFNSAANVTDFTVSLVTSAVPEPATWGMMVLGMGAVGFAMRRRKRTTRVAAIA